MERADKHIKDFQAKLIESEVKEFLKSDQVVRNHFKSIGGAKHRNKVLKEMKARGIIEVDGDLDGYRCLIRVV